MRASFPAASPPTLPPPLSWRRSASWRGGLPRLRVLGGLLALIERGNAARGSQQQPATLSPAIPSDGGQPVNGLRTQVDALYQRHARAVLAYLCRRLPSLADAEDALADVFLAALTSCADGTVPAIGWLLLVARRRVADFYRERERHPLSVLPLDKPTSEHEPETLSLKDEERRELLAMIAQLPDEQQEVLALRFAAGLRSAEIAAVIGKSEEATRAMLSRAVRRLRKEWVR
jgi:RNA polymerase sigma-70 factor, ECF subfamily